MESVSTFHVSNFGCRATQADGAALERQLHERGFRWTAAEAEANVIVLNTCTVTAAADRDARAAIRRIHRSNPQAQIVVTGCYAQRVPAEIAALPGVACVIGNSHKHQLAELLGALAVGQPATPDTNGSAASSSFVPASSLSASGRPSSDQQRIFVSDIFAHTQLLAAPVFESSSVRGSRTRPNLKVQDGCDNRCSFCVIPYVRGHSRSLPLEEIVREVRALVEMGYSEAVLSGINLGRWGRDLAFSPAGPSASAPATDSDARLQERTAKPRQPGFPEMIRAVLDRTALQKLRLSSVEPMDWSGELIELMATSPRIAKHAHVPMQSGSDAVLRRMHRKYRPWHYREKIRQIHAAMPAAAIGADVMVGFPGETGAEFDETRRMVEELPFTYLHVFTYSARPGTPAAAMGDQVPAQVAGERSRTLREIAEQKKLNFMYGFVGQEVDAVTLNVQNSGHTEALTDNYLPVQLLGSHPPNRWIRIRVDGVLNGGLTGRPV